MDIKSFLKKTTIKNTLMIAGMGCLLMSCGVIIKGCNPEYIEDNPIEEKLEEIFQERTGAEIDFTPFSPEG